MCLLDNSGNNSNTNSKNNNSSGIGDLLQTRNSKVTSTSCSAMETHKTIQKCEATQSSSSNGLLSLSARATGDRCQDEELQKAKHANYRDMVNYDALEVSASGACEYQ